jgi:hypothetical protein
MSPFRDVLESYGTDALVTKTSALTSNWDISIETVLKALCRHKDLSPNIRGNNLSENDLILKWINKYRNGQSGRISTRISNPPGTVADPVIDKIINSRITNLNNIQLAQIKFAHRLSMSAENILGLLLEEYIEGDLKTLGWHMCWGETIRSVDFCHTSGRLLQIKNRSNSENSSSSRVRIGTPIEKWHRVNAITGNYNWNELNHICGGTNMSESGFISFVNRTIASNPAALPIENNNPWGS